MTHRLVLAAAKIDLDLLAPNILPELAVELLIEGLDGPHLVRLAGESPASRGADLDALLGDVLQELGLERLSRVEAARAVRDDIARQVVSGSIDGIDGAETPLGAL